QYLSGHAITAKLVEGVQKATNAKAVDRLHVQVDRAKKDIDTSGGATIDVDGNRFVIDRQFAGEWLAGQKQVMSELFTTLLSQSQTKDDEISGIILSGSPAKLWLLDEILSERFGRAPRFNADIANGAAVYAALQVRQAKDWVVWDATAVPVMVAQASFVK